MSEVTITARVPDTAAEGDISATERSSSGVGHVLIVFRWLAAIVFIAAGALKVAAPTAFARSIIEYNFAPEWFVPAVAVLLPWWEVAAGVMAVFGRWRLGAVALQTAMSGGFVVLTAVTMARGLSPECGCFGYLSQRVGPLSLALKVILLAVCAAVLWQEVKQLKAAHA